MGHLFYLILTQPLLNLLVVIYNFIPDIGVAIILLTIIVRLLLMRSFHKSLKSQRQMALLQPKLNETREKHKEDKVKQTQAIMDLYKEHQISPFGSLLPLIVQLPLLFALYRVFILGLGGKDLHSFLYPFVHAPVSISPYFLHFLDLSKPNIYMGIVAGLAQFVQSKMMVPPASKQNDAMANAMAVQTVYLLPILTVVISLKLPAGLPLYWLITTLFATGQQYYIMRQNKANP